MKPRHEGDQPILSARGITNRFGTQVVHQRLDLDVERGEILGIMGGSGSGKSVLLKTLTGLRAPSKGTVRLEGKAIDKIGPAEKASKIGMLFQQGALFSSLTVAQNVMVPLREYTDLPLEERERIAAMKLELAGFPADAAMKYPAELSGGMVKRAAFARAIALDPQILFLDEPTSDLDPVTAGGIEDLIRRLNESLGMTIVIVTHDLVTLFTLCDRAGMLVDHSIEVDTIDKLARSQNPSIQEFLNGPRAHGAISIRDESHGNRR